MARAVRAITADQHLVSSTVYKVAVEWTHHVQVPGPVGLAACPPPPPLNTKHHSISLFLWQD